MAKSMACLTEGAQTTRCQLANVEAAMKSKNNQLHGLRWTNDGMDRALQVLNAEWRRWEVELMELRKLGQKLLVENDQDTDAVARKLADVCATVNDWKAKRHQVDVVHQRLKAVSDAEKHRTQTTLRGLHNVHDKLSVQLANVSSQLTATVADNQQMLVVVKKEGDRLDHLTSQVHRMEQKKTHECLIRSVEQAKYNTKMTLMKNEKNAEAHKLLLSDNQVNEFRLQGSKKPDDGCAANVMNHKGLRCMSATMF